MTREDNPLSWPKSQARRPELYFDLVLNLAWDMGHYVRHIEALSLPPTMMKEKDDC